MKKLFCKYCFGFGFETDKFESEAEFKEFDTEFQEKIKKGILVFVKNVPGYYKGGRVFNLFGNKIGIGEKTIHGYDLYKCVKCEQQWRLNTPENAWRGFFKRDVDEKENEAN
jgi:hypothetical protein